MEERGGLSPAPSTHNASDQNRVEQAQETGGNASADTSLDTTDQTGQTPCLQSRCNDETVGSTEPTTDPVGGCVSTDEVRTEYAGETHGDHIAFLFEKHGKWELSLWRSGFGADEPEAKVTESWDRRKRYSLMPDRMPQHKIMVVPLNGEHPYDIEERLLFDLNAKALGGQP